MDDQLRPSRVLATLGRRARKRLGQHFLADTGVARRIVDLAQLSGTERVVEIGPGLGALSALLAERARELWLIEVDADFAARHFRSVLDRVVVTARVASLLDGGEDVAAEHLLQTRLVDPRSENDAGFAARVDALASAD